MPQTDEISTGEIWRGLGLLREDIKGLTKAVEQRPDWNDLKEARTSLEAKIGAEESTRKAERLVADKAIAALEDWNKYAVRIVLTAAGTGIVGWIITQAFGTL
jgi:hypothetical protein